MATVNLEKGNVIWVNYLPDLAKLAEGLIELDKQTEFLSLGTDRLKVCIEGEETSWTFVYDENDNMWFLEVGA